MLRGIGIGAGCALVATTGALAVTRADTEPVAGLTPAQLAYGQPGPIPPPPPPPPAAVPPAPPPPPPPAAVVQQAVNVQDIAKLPSNKKCVSRRNFGIRLRSPRGSRDPLREGRVFVNGKQVRVVRGDRLRSTVNLLGLPKGRYVVNIVVTLRSGKFFRGTRRYFTCTKKLPGGIPKI